ncbi:MAG: hypothetical protein PHQ64_02695 [Bacilli bacterium]|nr:hypothetical protein [Bacilli bacterium]
MKKNIIISFSLLIIIVIAYVFIDKVYLKKQVVAKVVHEIKEYNYYLDDKDTDLYKEKYYELEKVLKEDNINYDEYAKLISQLFVIDFYTLDNKITNKDIGGVQFVNSNIIDNFKLNATSTIYKYLKSNLYGKRRQTLPIVTKIDVISSKTEDYEYNNTEDSNAYYIELKWDYKKDLDYPKSKTIVLVHDNNKLSIVEMK